MKNKLVITFGMIVIAVIGIAIVICIKTTGNSTMNDNEIKIGFIGPLTGEYAIVGTENLRGIQMAVDEINSRGGIDGKRVKLVIEDDQYQPLKTVDAFEKLTSVDNIKYIFTVSYAGFLSVAPKADEQKIIIIESLDTSQEIANAGDYSFGIGVYDEGIGFTLADFVSSHLHADKAAVIFYNGDSFPPLVKKTFKERFEQNGGQLVSVQEYDTKTRDFRTHIEKIKASNAQAVVIIGYDEAGIILRQAKEVGLNATMLGIDTTLSEGFKANAAGADEGIYFTSWEPVNQKAKQVLYENYVKKFSQEPQQPLFIATGYDSMIVLAQALQKSDLSTLSVKHQLYETVNMTGITGNLTMSSDGIVRTIEERMYRIENGTATRIN